MNDKRKTKWQKDLEIYYPIYNSFILEGCIDDDQPFEENGQIKYCRIDEYLDNTYSNHPDRLSKKRVIIYDPSEGEKMKFKICDTGYPELSNESGDESERKTVTKYDSILSQRFYDIYNSSELNDLLIDHKSSGASADFAQCTLH